MSCSNGVCTATAPDAVLSVAILQYLLGSGNLKVTTGTEPDDIKVETAVTWAAGNALTLDSHHSILVDQPVADNGPGGLALRTNDGGAGGVLAFGNKGDVTFLGLTNSLSINGTSYTLVGNIASLAKSVTRNQNGNYALARNYDASADGTYSSSPVFRQFQGSFEGLGNRISNLSITDTFAGDTVALFAFSVGSINNIGLINVKIVGPSGNISQQPVVGGLAVVNNGSMRGDFVTGRVEAGDYSSIGGLVGVNEGTLTNSYSTATVKGGGNAFVAGLAGSNNGGAILDSYATGNVSGGNVSYTGGLIGYDYGQVLRTHATGNVTGGNSAYVGGLIGDNDFVSDVKDSFASGAVKGGTSAGVGGLGGVSSGYFDQSFATGSVTAQNKSKAGGLVGFNGTGSIHDSYSTGAVTAGNLSNVGGLVGLSQTGETGTLQASYSTGAVSGGSGAFVGGYLGFDNNTFSSLKVDYWDTTTSGVTDLGQGAGNKRNDPGIKGLTTTQFQSGLPVGFSSTVWGEKSNMNGGLPYLLAVPPSRRN